MQILAPFKKYIILIGITLFWVSGRGQFYNGSSMKFGKNRVQHEDFIWNYYKFDRYKIHFYEGGKDLAIYTAKIADKTIVEFEERFDYYLDDGERINFIVYNKIEDFRQNNIGLEVESDNNIGGVTRISGANVFVYFNGSHIDFENNIREGISSVIINQMMFGDNWKEVLKNSALLNIPNWYMNGLISYFSNEWDRDMEDKARDAIKNKKFDKFNRLNAEEEDIVGHAIWNYVANTYGEKVIPNILYMSRVSRSVESGFLFVLGVSLKTLIAESMNYYGQEFISTKNLPDPVEDNELKSKIRRNRIYSNLKVNSTGDYAAFSTNQMGKVKVYLYDLQNEKLKKVFRFGYKLDRINNTQYPLIGWHPSGKILSVITEDDGQIQLMYYKLEDKKKEMKPMFKLEKVLDFDYAPDGRTMVLSAIANGQTDIYEYKVGPNVNKKLTDDIHDDLYPRFLEGGTKIIFSSNRSDDTLRFQKSQDVDVVDQKWDLFLYDYETKSNILKRVTNTPNVDETHPEQYDDTRFVFLSNETSVNNRYIAYFDSAISHIDTSIHYRYFTTSKPITNYQTNIIEQSSNPEGGKMTEIYYSNGKYIPRIFNLDADPKIKEFSQKSEVSEGVDEPLKEEPNDNDRGNLQVFTGAQNNEADTGSINIDTYILGPPDKGKKRTKNLELPSTPDTSETLKMPIELKLPNQRTYNISFTASDITTQFDFDFANQIYQRFNGGPYVQPGLGTTLKINMKDLFEDYNIEGGLRYSWNNRNTEFFLSYDDRSKRWDKKYTFQRQQVLSVGEDSIAKTVINQVQGRFIYPFDEVMSLRLTGRVRRDNAISLSTDRRSLEAPNIIDNWIGLKVEYVFDNSLHRGLNLKNNWRMKVWAEQYRIIEDLQTDITIYGVDARYYQKIHRNFIWANRFAASSSFGNRKLVYYLGGVDNWVVLGERQKFDFNSSIAQDQNYYFQTIATPVRGFIQNARNGNSFAVLNSELRFPVFKYFMNKPIKSEFLSNFQLLAFGDFGTAWTGSNPYSDENAFNTQVVTNGSITVILRNQKNPLIGGFGWGLRSKLWGYFMRFDYAWGVEDAVVKKPIPYLAVGMDF
ncbi:MAG: hypothetical protein MRY83_06815 [Flavobacteriales bacterium]|nr:hypothetical protein [Flavobacteriales bacterium]